MSEAEQINGGTEFKLQQQDVNGDESVALPMHQKDESVPKENEESTPTEKELTETNADPERGNDAAEAEPVTKQNGDSTLTTESDSKETDTLPENGSVAAAPETSITNGDAAVNRETTKEEKGEKRSAEANGVDEEKTDKEPEAKKQKLDEEEKVDCSENKEESTDKKVEEKENKKVPNEKEKAFKLHKDASHKRKRVAEKCVECDYKCRTVAEMRSHCVITHESAPRRKRMCANCNFTCISTWEMDYHARSRGHKTKEVITCKKCDHLSDTEEESWEHNKVHIPADKLFECGECSWNGDRLYNIRYHAYRQDHKMKVDYEAIAKARAAEKGSKELKHYETRLAKLIKRAKKGKGK